ncbi:hypothetical protein P389DRAFT_193070 [Cystobasidium minutum MCA 4210]|uniref:uncharacterized protein n=1 Tax=Cystobasidium minutum MCA 4210 TaxID=1397322 RepID=UPI0034CF1BC8|eukprot:jgi/Rhomi1/193070/gm1.1284_g
MDSDIPSLERSDSGGSSSSSSSTCSLSACSSLFSSSVDVDGNSERRSSFASSVFEGEDEEEGDKKQDTTNDTTIDSEASTPTPGLPTPSASSIDSTRIPLSRTSSAQSGSSDDGSSSSSSSSSHDSYISNMNGATPTAELYALSFHPITSPPTSSISTSVPGPSAAPSTSTTARSDQAIATNSIIPSSEQRAPHSSSSSSSTTNKTNDSIIISNASASLCVSAGSGTSSIKATSPDMLKFAARVASRGIPFSPMRVPTTASSAHHGEMATSSASTSLRPTTSRGAITPGRTLNAEGFPWTARPSAYSPRSATATVSSTSNRPSTSGSMNSYVAAHATSYGETPSAIFSHYDDMSESSGSEEEEEEEVEVLSELFPSSISSGRKSSRSRPVTRDGPLTSNSSHQAQLSRSSTAIPSSSSSNHATSRDTAPSSKSQSGAPSAEEQEIRHMQNSQISSAFGGAVDGMAQDGLSTATVSSSVSPSSSSNEGGTVDASGTALRHTTDVRDGDLKAALGALHIGAAPTIATESRNEPAVIVPGHSLTPLARSSRGALESDSTSTQAIGLSSSSSSMQTGTGSVSASSPLRAHSQNWSLNEGAGVTSSRNSTELQGSGGAHRERHEPLFRYEAPSSSTASSSRMASAALALPTQHQHFDMNAKNNLPESTASSTLQAPSILPDALKIGDASPLYAPLSPVSSSSSSCAVVPENVNLASQATTYPTSQRSPFTSYAGEARPQVQGRKASLDLGGGRSSPSYGAGSERSIQHVASSSLHGVHLNSLNYHAGSGNNTYSSRPSTSASAYISSSSSNNMARSWTRPWVKDSDSSSIKSCSGLSSGGSRSSFENSERELNVMSPAAPPHVPFLSTAPAPPGCKIIVEALQPDGFDIFITLPGFSYENITLALKKSGALHVLADKYEEDSHGHFERMVELGEAAKESKVTAVFNGETLEVHVRKLPKEDQTIKSTRSLYPASTSSFGTGSTSSTKSSASIRSGSAGASYEPPVYFGGTDPVAFYSSSPLLAGASYIAR